MSNHTGVLYVVALPIGHGDDLSTRARSVLASVDMVYAEDTRQWQRSASHWGLATVASRSLHEHNETARAQEVCALVASGKSVALVSDAGTPLISDPGYRVVAHAQQLGLRVSPLPGACAAVAALSVSGIASDQFVFCGFAPSTGAARRRWLSERASWVSTQIYYEAPHRIVAMLDDIVGCHGAAREVTLCRELTKTYETVRRAEAAALREWVYNDTQQQRGEIVLVVAGASAQVAEAAQWQAIADDLAQQLPPSHSAKLVAKWFDVSKREVYQYLQR